ncbi:ribokinase [Pokkaliibacter sp. CJK22405]|uniref:ribokinase n=1 Tax=Pokkaliibacter sp. CJK22405 TaxID=3384615 RepID=UPI00398568E4
MDKPLIVLGSVNADHILQVQDFPRPGETITGHGYQVVGGGKGANQAVAAARLGAKVRFIAAIGNDDTGQRMKAGYEADGIDTSTISVENVPTGIAIIYINAKGENCIGISAEANALLDESRVQPHLAAIRQAGALIMQLETPLSGCMLAAEAACEAGVPVILNPAPAKELPDDFLQYIDIITPNETEAEVLTGIAVTDEAAAAEAAEILHGKGIGTVVITLGSRGAFLSEVTDEGTAQQLIPGYRVEAVDTTAAGDTFNAGLMVGLLEGKTLAQAMPFAHAAAALSVTRLGAQTSIPKREEVLGFLERENSL